MSGLQEPVPQEPAAGSWRGGGCSQRAVAELMKSGQAVPVDDGNWGTAWRAAPESSGSSDWKSEGTWERLSHVSSLDALICVLFLLSL